jgi:ribose transport system ATP-binding protein
VTLEIRGLSKHFGGVQALRDVDLALRPGEIHALLGENGAGKSTLIKILAGVHHADAGSIATSSGLAFVHQDLGLVDELSVAENVALELGYSRSRGLISFRATERRVADLLSSVGVDVDPRASVGTLAQDQKVMVAVTRAVSRGAGVVVLDEVSSSLPAPEMARLADALRMARRTGVAYLYVTHRLEEVFELADRVTVLRDGRRVATADVAETSHDELVGWILGDVPAVAARGRRELGDVALRVDGPVPFDVRAGEILGICGLIGSGSRDVARLLGGATRDPLTAATLDGAPLPLGDPFALSRAGVAYVPGDRLNEGAVPELAVRENLFLARRPRRERGVAAELAERFDVRPRGALERRLATLSGGNQQKVIFARALARRPRLLVLDDPTAGVDVGSRAQLHGFLRDCAAGGAAVVLASTDFEEVAAVADRALVMCAGRLAEELHELTPERLARAAYGTTEVTS